MIILITGFVHYKRNGNDAINTDEFDKPVDEEDMIVAGALRRNAAAAAVADTTTSSSKHQQRDSIPATMLRDMSVVSGEFYPDNYGEGEQELSINVSIVCTQDLKA